jgi:hypothetical protein
MFNKMSTIKYSHATIKKLSRALPRGSYRVIQKRTISDAKPEGYSMQQIWFVINGKRYNQDILDIAFDYVAELKAKITANTNSL